MDNFTHFYFPVEKIVENVWKMCGKAVGKMAGFTHFFWQMRNAKWKKAELFTFFIINCGRISTFIVNKFFAFNRGEWRKIGGFTHFPHTLLL